ncbi:bifunctional methylenetetrahydrofolate dehydrogenase/methenyltetrahydrofolate cyclohydrolase FolD [Desulfolutivibrio sulfoxidireducens]|uniref:bifunctional methylenetetrahydrofolate dehydrogenase/methenyltetrahydrofolate cyclohydrolase FolD n=1 Tax=Desulfolutivibrio sulfoxidireducens TaxID=2773299 RepID=UPI00159E7398|nr:bifunctional methylenetetrahydrofolate dehydrogenase/methenyltetrahydrofolate cyclohydrolase FolD [Desulfolutivibrio sulfoxidireducens]QLA15948.1 bifunctional methylenetetrahydrofolate dehydrogenase/methenyltetrahydrofolate cyclohydrolase FolD [Desulfolutivibrio sulfoxidireducens]
MILIDGKKVAAEVRAGVKRDVERLRRKYGRAPSLAVVLVGEDPASQVYVRNKEKACEEAGIASRTWRLDTRTEQSHVERLVLELGSSDDIDGVLVQLPLPEPLDAAACLCLMDPRKDVDGFHPENVGRLSLDLPGLRPCTPAGVMTLLEYYALSPSGKKAVVLGRSNIVGKPMAMMLSANGSFANATVTVCHSRTPDIAKECRDADFLISAVGKAGIVTRDMVKPGAVVIDVGMNRDANGKLCGDVDFEGVKDVASAITPVPGGVGPMTIAMLMVNTANAFRWRMEEAGEAR